MAPDKLEEKAGGRGGCRCSLIHAPPFRHHPGRRMGVEEAGRKKHIQDCHDGSILCRCPMHYCWNNTCVYKIFHFPYLLTQSRLTALYIGINPPLHHWFGTGGKNGKNNHCHDILKRCFHNKVTTTSFFGLFKRSCSFDDAHNM